MQISHYPWDNPALNNSAQMFLLDDVDALIEEKIADFGLTQRVEDGKPMVVFIS